MNRERTPAFYLANLGSEVSRLISACNNKDTVEIEHALERARRIFTALEGMPLREAAKAEIALLKRVVEDLPKEGREFSIQPQTLQDYFMPFASRVLNAV